MRAFLGRIRMNKKDFWEAMKSPLPKRNCRTCKNGFLHSGPFFWCELQRDGLIESKECNKPHKMLWEKK